MASKFNKIDDATLKDLFNRVRYDNSSDAFNKIIRQFEPLFSSLTYQFLKNGLDRTEIQNELMSIASMAIIDYDESKDPSPIQHLTCRLRNGIWNYYTRQMLYFRFPKPISVGNISELPETGVVSYENAILDKLELEEALDELTEKQKLIIKLYFWEQYSQQDIANMLGMWQTAVSWNIKRSLKVLRRFYRDRELGYR